MKSHILGKTDYFSSLDKLADDFMPTKGLALPASKTNEYNFMDVIAPQKKLKYDPYKQKLTFIPEKKRFDPYHGSWASQIQKTLHSSPALENKLNPEQIQHLIHELRERGYSYSQANKIANETKGLSKKYMNRPWADVPKKIQNKFGNMDFDGDGVINSKDCFPFDYDRQAAKVTPYISNPTVGQVRASGFANASQWAAASAPATSSKPATSGGSSSSGSSNPYGYAGANQGPLAPSYISSSSFVPIVPLVTTKPTSGGGSTTTVITPQSSSAIVYRSYGNTGEQISYDGGKTWSDTGAGANIANYAGLGIPGTSATTTYTPGTAGTPDTPIYGTQTDYDKQQQIFDEILKGKEMDPQEIAYMKSIYNPIDTEAKNRMGVLQAQVNRQDKFQGAAGITSDPGAAFLNQKNINRANEIYNARQTDIQNKQTTLTNAANESQVKRLGAAALTETQAKSGDYTTSVQIGIQPGSAGTPGITRTELVPLNASEKTLSDFLKKN